MPLRVVGAGYPRTGTASLKVALEQLGFGPCHHMREIFMHIDSVPLWIAAADGKPDWPKIFKNYQSCTDAPSCTFWRELADFFPSAKVLLSVRDPEQWFESTQATVFGPQMRGGLASTPLKAFFQKIVYKDFGDNVDERDFMVAQFKRHTNEVIAAIPKDRLLVFDVREGWEPLCKFLGVAVPEAPFPKTNSREEMAAMRASVAGADPSKPPDLEQMQKAMRERFGKR